MGSCSRARGRLPVGAGAAPGQDITWKLQFCCVGATFGAKSRFAANSRRGACAACRNLGRRKNDVLRVSRRKAKTRAPFDAFSRFGKRLNAVFQGIFGRKFTLNASFEVSERTLSSDQRACIHAYIAAVCPQRPLRGVRPPTDLRGAQHAFRCLLREP